MFSEHSEQSGKTNLSMKCKRTCKTLLPMFTPFNRFTISCRSDHHEDDLDPFSVGLREKRQNS